MHRSNQLVSAGGAMIAAAAGMLFEPAPAVGWGLFVLGVGAIAYGFRRQEVELKQEANKEFERDYSVAVGDLLELLGDAYSRLENDRDVGKTQLLRYARNAPIPTPEMWERGQFGDAYGEELKEFSEAVYDGLIHEECDKYNRCRKTLKITFGQWDDELARFKVKEGLFERWLDSKQHQHAPVFNLWLYLSHAHAKHQNMWPPSFDDYNNLIDRWLR